MDSTYSSDSPLGSVSSILRLQVPPYWAAMPKLRQMDLACPIWRYPLGSGGKRVATRPWNLLDLRCSSIISLMKSEGGEALVWAIETVPFSCPVRKGLSNGACSSWLLNISYPTRLARPCGLRGVRKVEGRPRRFRCALPRESKIKRSLRLIDGVIGGIKSMKGLTAYRRLLEGLGGRLAVGLWTLAPSTEVRILAPQP